MQCTLDCPDSAELPAHAAHLFLGRRRLTSPCPYLLGIETERYLPFPVKILSEPCHRHVFFKGTRNTFGYISCVSRYPGSNYTFPHIVYIRKSDVLGRSNIAEEISSGRSGNSTTYGCCYMVVTHRNIRDQRTK